VRRLQLTSLGWRSVVSVSVPEIQAVQARAFKPAVMSAGKVHREIDMPAQGLKTGLVEPPDRTYVAGYRIRPPPWIHTSTGRSLRSRSVGV
jgi:hypothetical protein